MCKLILLMGEVVGVPPEKMPGKDGTILIANFALHHYGHFTVDEIKTAFMLAAAGELYDLDKYGNPVPIEHYHVFSAKYFGAVMNAYKIKGNQVAKEIIDQPEPLPEVVNKEADWTEAWEHIREQSKTKNPKDLIIPEPIYDWLVRTGKLSLDKEARLNLFKKARFSLMADLNIDLMGHNAKPQAMHELQGLKSQIKKGSDLYKKVLNRAKIMAVWEVLRNTA
jgi:hypothetical protein